MPVYQKAYYIEAIVWDGKTKYDDLPHWVRGGWFKLKGDDFIVMMNGSEHVIKPGSYLIRVGNGFRTLSKKMFERTYDLTKYQSLDEFTVRNIFDDNDWKEPVVDKSPKL